MFLKRVDGPRTVKLSNGRLLSLSDLPDAKIQRWVASRKEIVILAIASGLIGRDDAIDKYSLTEEELKGWELGFSVGGSDGLKATKLQDTRQS